MHYDVEDFEADVLEASKDRPVVVDFWAEWCGPCRILGPILEKLAGESDDRWRLAKVDTERFPEVAAGYGVRGIPNVKLFVDGEPVGEFVGALPEHLVQQWLDRMIPSDTDRALAEAIEKASGLEEDGRPDEAAQVLESARVAAPEDARLRLGLARIVVFEDPARARALLDHVDIEGTDQDTLEALLHLARVVEATPPSDPPEASAHRRAVGLLRARDLAGALEGFLDALRTGSESEREEAGRTCAALFHYLGPTHPLVARFRSAVASALYR